MTMIMIMIFIITMMIMIGILAMMATDPGRPSGTASRQVHLGATKIQPLLWGRVEGGGGALAIMPPQMQPNAVQTCTVHCFIKCDQTIVLGIALHSSEDHWRWTQQQLRGLHNILQKHIKIISKIFIELVVWCFSVDFSKIKWMQCNSALFQ